MRYIAILTVLCLCQLPLTGAKAQWVWDVTRESEGTGNPRLSSFSCSGQYCSVCGINGSFQLIVEHTTDAGKTWIEQDPGLPNARSSNGHHLLRIYQLDSLSAIASGYFVDSMSKPDSGFIVRTDDGGKTWSRQNLPPELAIYSVSAFHFSSPLIGIAIEGRYTAITTDGGVGWKMAQYTGYRGDYACHSDGDGKFRRFDGSRIFYTSNNWISVDSGEKIPDSVNHHLTNTKQCQFSGDTVIAYGALLTPGLGTAMVVVSTDRGMHWLDPMIADSTIAGFTCMTFASSDTVWSGNNSATFGHIAFSTDHGRTWRLDSLRFSTSANPNSILGLSRMPDGALVGMFAEDQYLDNSFFARAHFVHSKVEPLEFESYGTHVYPNPATSLLHIESFHGPVTILDPLGREYHVPQGEHTLAVSSLPPGVYFVSDGHTRKKFVKE